MNNSATQSSNFWLDLAASEIAKSIPQGKIVISSGISPSANYHIGHFREILTADALTWRLQTSGRTAEHIHVIDDFDPLRKRYDFLPPAFSKYVGWPLFLVPDPAGDCHDSYAEHYYANFEQYTGQMGIKPTTVVRNSELYRSGKMTPAIIDCIDKIDTVRQILAATSNRQLDEDWTPLQIRTEAGHFEQGRLSQWDKNNQTIAGVEINSGKVKMNWRLEWPARWRILGVNVEPFSHQEHGAAGGSYDTGVQISRQVFEYPPPLAGARYGNIHIKGDSKKMSSSKGNLFTPAQVFEVMPAEVLRYFVIKSRPEKQLDFDLQAGLYNLLEEFSRVEAAVKKGEDHEFSEAYDFAIALDETRNQRTISSVPFNHLVFAYQAAQADTAKVLEILARTGFEEQVKNEKDIIVDELERVGRWLRNYAPDKIKFQLQAKLPKLDLTKGQTEFLDDLAAKLKLGDKSPSTIHESVYETALKADLKPAEAFKLLYKLFLNQSSGPKIGYFLSSLESDFVIARISRLA